MVSRGVAAVFVACALASAACGTATKLEPYPDSFVGVGMILEVQNEWPVVLKVLSGGSASDAGVIAGDRVERIDGNSMRGLSLGEVIAKIRGEEGSQVTFSIRRDEQRVISVVPRRRMSKDDRVIYKAAAGRE